MVVATHAIAVGAQVYMELPQNCLYWRWPRVRRFFKRYALATSIFDGCMHGLCALHGKDARVLIKKPWRIQHINSDLSQYGLLRCDQRVSHHEHTPCSGVNAKLTEVYTKQICDIVHKACKERAAQCLVAQHSCVSRTVQHSFPLRVACCAVPCVVPPGH